MLLIINIGFASHTPVGVKQHAVCWYEQSELCLISIITVECIV